MPYPQSTLALGADTLADILTDIRSTRQRSPVTPDFAPAPYVPPAGLSPADAGTSVNTQSRLATLLPLLSQGRGPGPGGGRPGALVGPSGPADYPYRQVEGALPEGSPILRSRHDVTLQRGALRSLVDIARESNVRPGLGELGLISQGWRSLEAQRAGYASDPNRFAAPGTSYHGKGLAIDAASWHDIPALHRALLEAGWNQFSPTGEPWHYSFGVTG